MNRQIYNASIITLIFLFFRPSFALPRSNLVPPSEPRTPTTCLTFLEGIRTSDELYGRRRLVMNPVASPLSTAGRTPESVCFHASSHKEAKASSTGGEAGLLSTPLLAAIAGGTVILLTGTSIVLYCCVRRANRTTKQMPKEITRVISPLAAHEKQEQATSPFPVFDFSPPSPHWKPAPPSIALIMQKNVPHECNSTVPGLGYTTQNCPPQESKHGVPPPLRSVQQHPARYHPPPLPPLPTKSRVRNLGEAPIATSSQHQTKTPAILSATKDRRSGLGISTINLDLRSIASAQGSEMLTIGETPLPPKVRPIIDSRLKALVSDKTLVNGSSRKNSITRPNNRTSVYLAYDDVKLAYAASISSLTSEKDERILSMKKRRDAEPTADSKDEKNDKMPKRQSDFIASTNNASRDVAHLVSNTAIRRGNQITREMTDNCSRAIKQVQMKPPPSTQSRSKRLGLLNAVDDSHKSQLQSMASLGSDSFDSLLAYLTEAEVEPLTTKDPPEQVRSVRESHLTKEKLVRDIAPLPSSRSTMAPATRNDTHHTNHFAFETWLANAPKEVDEYVRNGGARRNSSSKEFHGRGNGERHGIGIHSGELSMFAFDVTAETTLIDEYCMEVENEGVPEDGKVGATVLETTILNQGRPDIRATTNFIDNKTGTSGSEKIIDARDTSGFIQDTNPGTVTHSDSHDKDLCLERTEGSKPKALVASAVEGKPRNPTTQLPETATTRDKFSGKSKVDIASNCSECTDTKITSGATGLNFPASVDQSHLVNSNLIKEREARGNYTFVDNYNTGNMTSPLLSCQMDSSFVLPLRIKPKSPLTPKEYSSTFSWYRNKDNSRLPSFSVPSSATKLFSSLDSEKELKSCLPSSREQSFSGEKLLSRISRVDSNESLDDRNQPKCLADALLARLSSSPSMPPSRPLSFCSSSSVETLAFQDWCRESLTPRFNHLRAVLEGRFEDPPAMPPIDHPDIQAGPRKFALQASSAIIGRESEVPTTRTPVRVADLSHAPVNSSLHQSHETHHTFLHKHPLTELHSADISVRTPRIVLEDVSECYSERHVEGRGRVKHCSSGEWLSDKKTKMNVL